MIKRFRAKGIVGVPDCDVTFDSTKMIIIQGPNGAGKTSFLKRITHPYRSINGRSVELKDNCNEGYIESYIRFNGNDYMVQHTIERKKNGTYTNKSYLLKMIDGKYTHMVDDGSVSKFATIAEREFDYTTNQYDVLNIGVSNFGILHLKNADRLETMKQLFKLDVIDEIAETVREKTVAAKNNLTMLNNEIQRSESIEKLTTDLSMKQRELYNLGAIVEQTKRTMGQRVTPEEIAGLKRSIDDARLHLLNSDRALSILDKYKEHGYTYKTIEDLKINLHAEMTEYKYNLDNDNDRLIETIDEINNIKTMDSEKLTEERDNLKSQLNDKLTDMTDTYELYKGLDIRAIENNLNLIDTIMESAIDVKLVHNILNDIEYYKNLGVEKRNNLNTMSHTYDGLNEQIKNLIYQENIVSLTPHKDTPLDCPLRMEWSRQIGNKDEHIKTREQIEALTEEIEFLTKDLDNYRNDYNIANKILKLPNPDPDYRMIPRDNSHILGDVNRSKLLVNIKQALLANENHETRVNIINRIKNIEDSLAIITNSVNQSKNKIEERKLSLEKSIKHNQEQYDRTNKLYTELEKSIPNITIKDYLSIEYNLLPDIKIEKSEQIETLLKEEVELTRRFNDYEKNEANLSKLLSSVTELNADIKLLNYKIDELQKKINQRDKLTEDHTHLKNIRDIVKSRLLVKLMEPKLRKIETIANNLLNGFLSMHFDLTDGALAITCERDGITRDSSVLSNGESSMLSIALMMAMKDYIIWDVVSIDEGSAMLDEENKDRFVNMLRDYASTIPSISQMFVVSHDTIIEDGMDIMKLKIKNGEIR